MGISTISGMALRIKRWSLTSYLGLAVLLGVILISGLWVFVQYQITYDYDRAVEENSRETMNLAKAFEEHVRKIVVDGDKDLLNLQKAYERDGISSPVLTTYFENMANDPSRTSVVICNEQGIVIKSFMQRKTSMNRSEREYYQFHQQSNSQELYIGLPIVGRMSGRTSIPLTRRINKPDGTFGGIVFIGLSTDYFLSYYQKIDLGDNQLLSLSGLDGFNRARQVNDNSETGQDNRGSEFWKNVQEGNPSATYVATNILDGVTRITSYRVMSDYPLIVAVGRSTQVALVNFERRKRGYIFGASLVSIFIIGLLGLVVNWQNKQGRIKGELLRLDRLNLVGEMAASIAHEIRNPLTTVRGYLQWYLAKGKYAELKMPFTTMIEELDRANAIITEYLSLAKNKSIELKLGNINNVIDALFPLLEAEAYNYGHALRIEKNDVPEIFMDNNELRQLLLNMVRNGFDAMETSGMLTIKSYVERDMAILAVHDTGNGIPQAILDKLGTPFLTTKDAGTGLGLAVCYQIVARHGAKIEVKTSSEGTTFYVKFKFRRVN